ncbi:MAG: glycosyltransferase family 9 protein [Acidobacteriota bacterium]|nr:glycosyltransferase family 9 protein [Acidobacteriota bacterium]MDH3785408.1 glycosyltransferase family 9 protein [Acidobacteriota bacterium]
MRVLLVHTGFLGDLLLLHPLIRKLAAADAVSTLGFLTTAVGDELYRDLVGVDRIHRFEKRKRRAHVVDLVRLIRTIRGEYDVVLVAHRSHRSGLIARLSGAPQRIGFGRAAGRWAYTRTVPWDGSIHVARRYGKLARPILGDGTVQRGLQLPIDEASLSDVRSMLGDTGVGRGRRLAVVAPGATWATKRWTEAGFVELGQRLVSKGFDVVVSGSAGESSLCRRIASLCEGSISLAGRTGLRHSLALFALADVAVCNDSGSGHLAGAAGCPVVSIFGPTVPEMGYTVFSETVETVQREGLDCRPCHRHGPARCPLRHHDCVKTVESGAVWAAVERVRRSLDLAHAPGIRRQRLANNAHRSS